MNTIDLVAPPNVFASAFNAFVFAVTVVAALITAISDPIPAVIAAAESFILYVIVPLFDASSITLPLANVTSSVITIFTASFNPDETDAGILLASSDILYTTAFSKSAIVFAFAIVEFPSTVTVPAVDNKAFVLPAIFDAESFILYVLLPLFDAASIIPASDTVASSVATIFTALFLAIAFPPAIADAVSDIL